MIWIGLLIPFCFSSEGSERADEKPWAGFTWPDSETSSRLRDGDWSVRFRATEKPKDTVAFCLTCILIYYMIPINFFLQISLLSKNSTARVRDSTPRPVLFLSLSMFVGFMLASRMFLLLRPKQPSPASSYLVTRPRHLPLSKVLECKRDCNGLQLVDLCRTMQIYVWYIPWITLICRFASICLKQCP